LAAAFLEDERRLPEEALQQVEHALSLSPGSATAHIVKADILAQALGEVRQALAVYEQAVRMDPSQTQAYRAIVHLHESSVIGRGHRIRNDLDDFIARHEALRAADPDQPWVHGVLAYAYKSRDSFEKSIDAFKTLLRFVPGDADVHCELAELYERTGHRLPALDHWSICAAAAPASLQGRKAEGHRDRLSHASITSPLDGAEVTGEVEVRGSAVLLDTEEAGFQFYKVEIGRGEHPDQWSTVGEIVSSPVTDGVLAVLDADNLPVGKYTIRLVVVDTDGNYPPPCEVAVQIEN
jgi:tetratricopeptide (TPR) repeat protein